MRAPELLAEVAVRPPAGGHAMSKGHAYSPCPATSTTQCCPSSSCRRATSGTSYWGTTTWNPGRSSCTADPSVNNMSKPKTQQDRERGDELTARVFAPGRSILSTMGAILWGHFSGIRRLLRSQRTHRPFSNLCERDHVRICRTIKCPTMSDGAVRYSRTNRRASRAIVGN